MARKLPTIPENILTFYRNKLTREVTNLFEWEGVPDGIPVDYLERALVLKGRVMFFYDDEAYGFMALESQVRGFNMYNKPTTAFSVVPNTEGKKTHYERKILYGHNEMVEKEDGCVLINNMYGGESLTSIIDHFAKRLALVQMAFDTNALWQNKPVVFSTTNEGTRLSIEKFFNNIMNGEPWVVVDKELLAKENGIIPEVVDVPFILDKLYDTKNEIYAEFRHTVGIDTAGIDKKERVLTGEIDANKQSIETCLQIMLSQREIACKQINKFFGLNMSVKARGEVENGPSDSGIEDTIGY